MEKKEAVALFKKASGKVSHLNLREEKHGEDSVAAVDVKVILEVPNMFLDELSPGLRAALYRADGNQLEGVEQPLSILRFPQLAPLDWEILVVQGEFTLHGARKAEDLVFQGDVKKALRLACKEGGTVEVALQVAVLPAAEGIARLSELLGRSVKVSLVPVEQAALPPVES